MEFLAALIFLRIVIWTIKDVQRFEHRLNFYIKFHVWVPQGACQN